jgi:hypothetical protein
MPRTSPSTRSSGDKDEACANAGLAKIRDWVDAPYVEWSTGSDSAALVYAIASMP